MNASGTGTRRSLGLIGLVPLLFAWVLAVSPVASAKGTWEFKSVSTSQEGCVFTVTSAFEHWGSGRLVIYVRGTESGKEDRVELLFRGRGTDTLSYSRQLTGIDRSLYFELFLEQHKGGTWLQRDSARAPESGVLAC